ncbi:MAG TPA: LPXTG cell wall anchor domain-containing protein, partial [Ilumatobacter sp.]|nr:LPXTG cell wall anchor domain-containing protein [Ilumatobacter sp.]
VQGTGTVTAAVPAGTYALAETTKPGYASTGFSCSTGQAGSSVTVPDATEVTCTIINEDEPVADVAIVKNASVPQVGAGGGFTWLLDVTNNGPDPALAVVVGDIVPGQVTVTGVSSAQFSCSNSGNTVTCTKPSMAVGETGSISIAVTVPAVAASGSVVNIGSVTATTPDNNASNNSDDASVTIVAQAPPPPTPPPVILPPTGSNSTTPVTWAAISLVLIGGMVMLVSRRRRDHTSVR